jgi:hypothetical protein
VEDLTTIAAINGPYVLTKEAEEFGTDWYVQFHTTDHPFKHDERFVHYLARKQAHVHKAAMLRAASLRDDRVITKEDLRWALTEVTALEPNMVKTFGGIAREEIVSLQVKLLGLLRERGKLKKQALYKEVMFSVGYETFNKALESLMGTGLVNLVQHSDGLWLEFIGEGFVQEVAARQPSGSPQKPASPE